MLTLILFNIYLEIKCITKKIITTNGNKIDKIILLISIFNKYLHIYTLYKDTKKYLKYQVKYS